MFTYLDNNATTPLDPRVLEAMLPWLGGSYGNASSVHRAGRRARNAVDRAREQVAELVGAQPRQVVFTSGGTEANHLALRGAAATLPPGRLLLSPVEHPSVLAAARILAARGWTLEWLPVDEYGRLSPAGLMRALERPAHLVSVMWGNNETGVLQDLPVITATARGAGALVHSDAVQAVGKVPVDFTASGLHLMSLGGHKFQGPAGIGALIVDSSVELQPLLPGGGQEYGIRGGTENVAAIAGLGRAAELARQELGARQTHMRDLRDRLESGLAEIPLAQVLGQGAPRLPNTSAIVIPGIEGETLLMNLDRSGIAVSSGSACSSGKTEPSHVLVAMGVEPEAARGMVRISLGPQNTREDVDRVLVALQNESRRLRGEARRLQA